MKSLNHVQIIGNLTRDPELKTTNNGTSVCSFSIATNRKWKSKDGKDNEEVEYHNCVAWSKLAEIVSSYLKKGNPCYVSGHLKTNSWEKDGTKHYRTEIVLDDLILLGGDKGTRMAMQKSAEPEYDDGEDF